MSVYYRYTGHVIQRPSVSYILEATPDVPGYPYKCINRTSGGVYYLYCSKANFAFYSSTYTATSKQELSTSGEYISFRYYGTPTDTEATGYWASSYSGPYAGGTVNTWGTKIWANHTINDSGLYSNHFYSNAPEYVSGAVDFYRSSPEGSIILQKGESATLGFSLVDENGKVYSCSNVSYKSIPTDQCGVEGNVVTVLEEATDKQIEFIAYPVIYQGTTGLSDRILVFVGSPPYPNSRLLMEGLTLGLGVKRMRGTAEADITDAELVDGVLYIKNAAGVLDGNVLEVK